MYKTLYFSLISLLLTLLLVGCADPQSKPTAAGYVPVAYTPLPARAITPGSAPILQLNPGGHAALIHDIAFTPDGRYLLSASDDKTIRVWDLHNPGQSRIIRGQQGEGHEGKIYAMALSPDGRTLAVGGMMATFDGSNHEAVGAIRLHDLATGQVRGLLRGHTNVVDALAFSPDGQQLLSGSQDKTAIIWDVPSRSLRHRLEGHTDHIYAVAFTQDGARVVTGSNDNDLRLWAASDGQLIQRMTGHTDKVYAVAVAADGTIASGSWDHTIRLWDGHTGAFLNTLANQGTQVGSLSFSPDGRQLLSGVSSAPTQCHLYSVPDGKELRRYSGHDDIVIATAFSADGQQVATAGGANQEIHIWDPTTGQLQQRLAGGGASTWAVGINADGSRVAWGNTSDAKDINDRGPLSYQLPLVPLGTPTALPATAPPQLRRAVATLGDWSLQHVKGGNYGGDAILEIRRNGQMQAQIARGPTDGYDHRAYTFTPDGTTIISGGMSGVLSAYDRAGSKLGDFVGHTGDVWAVAVSGDGRVLVSGSDDQTVRVWNVASRELLLTVFNNKKDNDWVAWTPQGYYAASPNGDRMVGWQINHGPDQTPDYIEAAQLRDKFYRPDIVTQALALGSATQAVAQARDTAFRVEDLARQQPPQFQVLAPDNGSTTTNQQLDLVLDIPPQPQDTPLEQAKIYVNGRLAAIPRLGKTSLPIQAGGQRNNYTISLQPGTNNIRIEVSNTIGTTTRELSVTLTGRAEKTTGDLYLIAVGVSDYATDQLDLKFAAADATAFTQALTQHTAGLYNQVHTTLLVTGAATPPTAAAIRTALDLPKQAKPADTIILFFAGHGMSTSQGYKFLPQDTRYPDGNLDLTSTVGWEEIQRTLQDTNGQRIMFVDTCHSGAAFNSRLIKDAADGSILVFSATDSNTSAIERAELGHGVFTYAILEGLDGKADLMPPDQHLMIKELDTYVSYRVKALTEGLQVPTIHTPGGFPDFEFASK